MSVFLAKVRECLQMLCFFRAILYFGMSSVLFIIYVIKKFDVNVARENCRGADRRCTLVVCGPMRLAPRRATLRSQDVSAADLISRNVFAVTFGHPFRVCVCAGVDVGDNIIILLISRFRYHSRRRN